MKFAESFQLSGINPLKIYTENKAIEIISKKLKGYSNRSIVFILDDAAKKAKRNGRKEITLDVVIDSCFRKFKLRKIACKYEIFNKNAQTDG